ncbi:hypothetical protein GOP47_0029905 [Adiantum capillus-veneris]|nr:hypothetical protein GOP47_0029905 [Adiantum capillus-veneris]
MRISVVHLHIDACRALLNNVFQPALDQQITGGGTNETFGDGVTCRVGVGVVENLQDGICYLLIQEGRGRLHTSFCLFPDLSLHGASCLTSLCMDAIFNSVKEKIILSGFLRTAVEEAVNVHGIPRDAVVPYDVVPLSKRAKLEDLNEKCAGAIKKFFDQSTNEFVGTFVFLHKTIGITAFHSVAHGQYVLNGETLAIDGLPMSEANYIELGREIDIYKGGNFYVAAYLALDLESSMLMDEDILITPGAVSRRLSRHSSDFITGAYKSCRGSSGGAVLTINGKLIGMHLHNEFHEDNEYHTMSDAVFACPEDYKIKAPKTYFRYERKWTMLELPFRLQMH